MRRPLQLSRREVTAAGPGLCRRNGEELNDDSLERINNTADGLDVSKRKRRVKDVKRKEIVFWHLDVKEISHMGFYTAALCALVCLSVLALAGIYWFLLWDINSERGKDHLYSSLYHHCLAQGLHLLVFHVCSFKYVHLRHHN